MNNQVSLPHWARKPNHKKEVVATPLGWMVKETGEYLKMVRNLDSKLRELNNEIVELLAALDDVIEPVNSSNTQDQVEPVLTADVATVPATDDIPPVVEEPKKRRGRPRKSATTSTK